MTATKSEIQVRNWKLWTIGSAELSVTRLGKFWKFLVTNFLPKLAQIIGDFLGNLEITSL